MKIKGFIIITLFLLVINVSSKLTCKFGTVSNGTHCEECGITDFDPIEKIVGGIVENRKKWPWAVLFIQNFKTDYMYLGFIKIPITLPFRCGGTLINQDTVVSAAHCIKTEYEEKIDKKTYKFPLVFDNDYPTLESTISLYFGANDVSGFPDTVKHPAEMRKVSKIIMHPDYDSINTLNDIVILKLEKPVKFNEYIKPACLPRFTGTHFPAISTKLTAIGWGRTIEGGNLSSLLKSVELKVHDPSYCSIISLVVTTNWKLQICAGDLDGGNGVCHGDSGGGLFSIDTKTGRPRQVLSGISSLSYGCAKENIPAVFVRPSYYLNWIKDNMVTVKKTVSTTRETTTTKKPTTITITRLSTTTDLSTKTISSTTIIRRKATSNNSPYTDSENGATRFYRTSKFNLVTLLVIYFIIFC